MYLQLWFDGESIRRITRIKNGSVCQRTGTRIGNLLSKLNPRSYRKTNLHSILTLYSMIPHLDPNYSWVHNVTESEKKKKTQNQNSNHVFYDRSIFHKLVSFIDDKNPLYPFLNKSVQRSSVDRFHGFRDKSHRSYRSKRGQNARKGERCDTVVARVTARWELNTFRRWWLAIGRSKESEWGLRAEKREECLERER